jgi:hypothetical protein
LYFSTINPIFFTVINDFLDIANHKNGCCIIQRIIDVFCISNNLDISLRSSDVEKDEKKNMVGKKQNHNRMSVVSNSSASALLPEIGTPTICGIGGLSEDCFFCFAILVRVIIFHLKEMYFIIYVYFFVFI